MKYPEDFINKIICGDCLEVMKKMPDNCVDLVLTDPPYGITKEIWDILPDWKLIGREFQRILKNEGNMFVFGMQPTFSAMILAIKNYFDFKDEIIWFYKDGGAGNTKGTGLKNCHQNIAWFSNNKDFIINIDEIRVPYQKNERNRYPVRRGKKIWQENPLGAYPSNVLEIPKHKEILRGKTQFHKHYTIKPHKLIDNLIRGFSGVGDIILDPFLGSGTTVESCKETKRNFIGIEINPEYCKIAEKRLAQGVL